MEAIHMTKDIVVITDTSKDSFARAVFNSLQELENRGYNCEVKFSTTEKDNAWNGVQYSALIHAYEAE
jgi:hypothetical protein